MTIETPPTGSESGVGSGRMHIYFFGNEFPSDDLSKLFRRISIHAKDRKHVLLSQLLLETTCAVKEEIRQLPTALRQSVPPFDSILSWADDNQLREGSLGSSVDGVLLIVLQLASYVGYAEVQPGDVHNLQTTCLTGLGIGLLASTALSLSSQLAQVPTACANAARIAFRLGVHVQAVSALLESQKPSTGGRDSWAYVVHNVEEASVQRELDAVNSSKQGPQTSKIFVSAVSRTSVTISGPPSELKALFIKSKFFRDARLILLPVFGGLCHAPHIYGSKDIELVVSSSSISTRSQTDPRITPIYSTSTGLGYSASSSTRLYEEVVGELLMKPIYWDRAIDGVVDVARCALAAYVVLYNFGNSIPFHDLHAALMNSLPSIEVSCCNILATALQGTPNGTTPRGSVQAKLAIVGMSCRLPGGATNTEKFWKILESGLDVSRRIPADRFDIDTHYDPSGKQLNKSMTQYGCFIDEPGLFDAPFFNMSPREAHVADPQMRLSLVTAYEALERSGFVGNRTASTRSERIGTFYGQAADDYREVNQGQEVGTYYIPGGCRAFGPGRINYFFKFAGPSYSIDTACSSGLAAIEVACQSLWNGEVDMAVAGGVNVLTNPDGFTGLCNGHFLTKGHNACKTWDATADGYCRADGVGSLVIKRLGDAEADNDNILGVVLAAGTNHSAHAVSITHPHAGHQAYLSRKVLRQAGVDPLDVSYVELHGTGTQAGDREEMEGVVNVYAPLNRRRGKEQHLHIGAVKANVGHGESVAGTTALIKVLLMLEKNAIPPHIGIKTEINPTLPKDLDKRNVHIPKTMIPWTNGAGKKRIAAVNNFGAAGGNTTLILEEAHISTSAEPDHRQSHVVAISAKTRTSLTGNIERLIAYLDERPDTSIADLGYTTTARRYHHGFRVAAPVSDLNSLRKLLRSKLEQVDAVRSVDKSGPPQVAFTFTGQGASSKSMNLELYHDAKIFREHIHYLDSIVQRQGFPSVLPALDGSFPKNHSHSPVVTQLSLVCVQIALIKYWASLGVTPDIVMGHSLGEYAAMHAAGVISAAGAIYLVGRRAQMLQEKCQIGSHVMVAVRASEVQVAKAAQGKPYTIACVNGPSDTVLSGSKEETAAVTVVLEAAGYRCISLDVAFAFHSQQTDPILDDFEAIAKTGVTFNEPDLPVISPLLGKVVFDSKTLNAKYVRKATRDTVDFLAAMENARATSSVSNETVWVEIGPHSVCTSFVKAISPSTRLAVPSFRRDEDNWKTVADSMAALYLAGVPVRWHEFHQPFERRLRLLDLPTYAWNEKTYWIQYNGDWCLTKGNDSYALKSETTSTSPQMRLPAVGELQTTTVQSVVLEKVDTLSATITMQSDLMQPELLKAANGHRMNDCGVVTSSIHADIAYTLGQYVYRRLYPKAKAIDINVANLVVTKGLVASKKQTESQVFQVTASTSNITAGTLQLIWQKVDANGHTDEPFATATVSYESASQWLSTWTALAHLVQGRIDALEHLAASGKANRFSHSMAYTLFAQNLVDYAEKYRGMQSVVMDGLEGFAEVELSTKEGGSWTVPPYFIDSVAHLAGFIMNCSDKIDVRNNFCVTPGWESMRFAQPLVAGQQYRSYVKMIPTTEDPAIYFGDVYIMHESTIIGMVGGIQFRRYPRILLNRFFSPPEHAVAVKTAPGASSKPTTTVLTAAAPLTAKPHNTIADQSIMTSGLLPTTLPHANPSPKALKTSTPTPPAPTPTASSTLNTDSVANRAILLVANEAGLEFSDLEDDCSFADVGIDSLLSLVIAEKLRSNFDVKVGGSLFLDYPTVGDMRKWLEEYYG